MKITLSIWDNEKIEFTKTTIKKKRDGSHEFDAKKEYRLDAVYSYPGLDEIVIYLTEVKK